jgi:hypothetical protein
MLWGLHNNGDCDGCGDQETIRHFLLECPTQAGLQDELSRICARNQWTYGLGTVLSQPTCLDVVYKWIEASGRRL